MNTKRHWAHLCFQISNADRRNTWAFVWAPWLRVNLTSLKKFFFIWTTIINISHFTLSWQWFYKVNICQTAWIPTCQLCASRNWEINMRYWGLLGIKVQYERVKKQQKEHALSANLKEVDLVDSDLFSTNTHLHNSILLQRHTGAHDYTLNRQENISFNVLKKGWTRCRKYQAITDHKENLRVHWTLVSKGGKKTKTVETQMPAAP